MSIYHEWFTSDVNKITVQKQPETVQNRLYSFRQGKAEEAAPIFTIEFEADPAPWVAPTVTADPAPLPPIRKVSHKPALPVDLWASFATFGEAFARWNELKRSYVCALGRSADGFTVDCDPAEFEVVTA